MSKRNFHTNPNPPVIGANLLIVITIAYKILVFIMLNEVNFFRWWCYDVIVGEVL